MLSTQLWVACNCIPQGFGSVIPCRLEVLPSSPLKKVIPPCSFLILTVMPAIGSVYMSVCHTGLTLTTELRGSLPLPGIVEKASLLSSKGSSDKKRVKTPESLSPEERDFSCFVHFLLHSLFFPFVILLSFSSASLSPAGWGRILSSQGPMMEGNLSISVISVVQSINSHC